MRKLLLLFLILIIGQNIYSQTYSAHLLGVKAGVNLSGVSFYPKQESATILTKKNFSFSYIYYHSLWKSMPYFGFQTELSMQEQGYILNGERITSKTIEIPFVSKFHIDFWKMRFLINAGGFAGYRKTKSDGFAESDYRYDAGFIGGAGFAFVFDPFEVHLEGNYHYSLTYLYDPQRESQTRVSFAHPNQLLISLGLYFKISGK